MRCALFDEIRRAERVVLFGRTATPLSYAQLGDTPVFSGLGSKEGALHYIPRSQHDSKTAIFQRFCDSEAGTVHVQSGPNWQDGLVSRGWGRKGPPRSESFMR